ncbi:MAG: type II secretion system protein GspM [Cellvibrionaceae bacterium]|nr:type II secretion system protein GspM [Cellvibrionaceae bacterium]
MRVNAQKRAQILIAIILAVALILLVFMWLSFFNSYMQSSRDIYRLQPLMARLVGVESMAAELVEANTATAADIKRYAFTGQSSADAASAALQQKVRGIAMEQGFTVSGSQILASTEGDSFQRLSINMTLNGPMTSLVLLLESFSLLEPAVVISNAQLSPARSRNKNEQRVNVRLTLTALRWLP